MSETPRRSTPEDVLPLRSSCIYSQARYRVNSQEKISSNIAHPDNTACSTRREPSWWLMNLAGASKSTLIESYLLTYLVCLTLTALCLFLCFPSSGTTLRWSRKRTCRVLFPFGKRVILVKQLDRKVENLPRQIEPVRFSMSSGQKNAVRERAPKMVRMLYLLQNVAQHVVSWKY